MAAALLLGASQFVSAQELVTSEPSDQAQQQRSSQRGLADRLRAGTQANPDAKMLVHADELVYDHEREQVSAVGNVQIYYDGAVLEADRVTHDQRANRLHAHGNVRYMTKDGNVIHGQTIELAADFRDGFIESLLVETPERTRFGAARATRREGNITEFESGIYTACEPCKDNPERPPLWQVKAARIIHDEAERVIHYENASLEFFGVPVAWLPYFWHPDPTVKRQSGFLMPTYFANNRVGVGVNIPYYWALAPNYDLTVSVAPLTRQIGPLVSGEWRHRLMNGSYMIRAAGVFQQDKDAFIDEGRLTPGYRDFRGSVESKGRFRINNRWSWGWDATLLSDRFFLSDYTITGRGVGTERSSQIYLTGQGERSYFDARAMGFLGFSRLDHRDQLPFVHPVVDYSYVYDNPVFGGELGYRVNLTSVSREQASFDPINNTAAKDKVCDITRAGFNPDTANCLMRGTPGDYTRFSTEVNWRRTLTNPWGMVFKPFASVRADVATRDVDGDVTNISQFAEPGRETLTRAMPAAGMEVRWPFISVHSWGTQMVEPIGQIIVRPNETDIGRFPNEDAQSLVFDDSNLFAIDKYSGYDRVEGGTRANVGVQYTANIHRYGMINALFGQSYHLFGRNSFAYSGFEDADGNQTGLGLESGLERDVSDYVARLYYQPVRNLSFVSRFRFDRRNFDVRRLEVEARANWDHLSLSTIYARYDAQPLIGFLEDREAIYQTASLRLYEGQSLSCQKGSWGLHGGMRYDLDKSEFNLGMVGVNYVDECFAATLSYIADYSNLTYTKPVHRVMLRVNLRTIGGTSVSSEIGSERTEP